MMGSRVAAWTCGWVLLSVVACGKSEGGAEPISRADLPNRIASLLCDSMAACCKASGVPLDPTACKASYAAELQHDFDDQPERLRYDAQAAGDCLAAAESKVQCGSIDEDVDPACERVFVGTVALGQPCDQSRECAPVASGAVHCSPEAGSSQLVCTASSAEPHGKAGDACNITCSDGRSCGAEDTPTVAPGGVPEPLPPQVACYVADGLYCDAGKCAPLLTIGEACDNYVACRAPAFCHNDAGVCTAPQPDGAPCDGDNNCQSKNCQGSSSDVADPAAPVTTPTCVSATTVTAEQCADAADADSPDSVAPAEPGAPAGTP